MTKPHPTITAGWREWVALPELGVEWVKAKLDTGARTSALHAFDLEEIDLDGVPGVRFGIHPWQNVATDAVEVECQVHDRRHVRSSSGHVQERIVVLLDVVIHGYTVPAEFTLTNRDQMGFRMLIGREVLRQGFVVDSSRSFLSGRAPRIVRRANRGLV
ncbi:MAG TPA: RimK/LysX family protein [Candidatus Lumbricidophila sp.]|nr:RimK/LysX family protein [Candidatus Lumbricidophila sp.]